MYIYVFISYTYLIKIIIDSLSIRGANRSLDSNLQALCALSNLASKAYDETLPWQPGLTLLR